MSGDDLKERSKAVWGTGDYGPTSRQLEQASHALVDALGITADHRVLDVAAGDGNCALAAARCGAVVDACDFSAVMLETGRARTAEAGAAVTWWEADAADLPFPDGSFDRVTSVFGAIFAPEQEAAAAEAVRVARPGGMVGLTAWTDDGYTARLLEINRLYGPPLPADAPDPLRWGRPDELRAIFGALGCEPEIRRRSVTFRYSSWQECRHALEAHGMSVIARERMPAETYAQRLGEIRELIAAYDVGEGEAICFDADYLEILVTAP